MIKALFSNDDILIIDKPAGLAVQSGEGVGLSLLDVLEKDFAFKPYLVHRLDKETSGCLLVAKSSLAARLYSTTLSSSSTHKLYRAIILGKPREEKGVFDTDVRYKGRVFAAKTSYRVIDSWKDLSLVEAELGTGRTHQIRQHFAYSGWPIVADDKYGNFKRNRELAKSYGVKRLMLYAHSLSILKPVKIAVEAEPPLHFKKFLEQMTDIQA